MLNTCNKKFWYSITWLVDVGTSKTMTLAQIQSIGSYFQTSEDSYEIVRNFSSLASNIQKLIYLSSSYSNTHPTNSKSIKQGMSSFCQLFLKILWSQTDIPSYQYRWRSYIWAPTSFIWISQLMTNEISCLHFSSKIRLLIFKLTSFSYVSFKVEESQSNVSLILFALSEDFSSCICLKHSVSDKAPAFWCWGFGMGS